MIEKVDALVASNGRILHREIVGTLKMKSFLSGMPELTLGLNDRIISEIAAKGEYRPQGDRYYSGTTTSSKSPTVELENVRFHHCVRLNKFETDRTISFIPPDGEFELMSYRFNSPLVLDDDVRVWNNRNERRL